MGGLYHLLLSILLLTLPHLTTSDRLLLISFDGFRWDYLKFHSKQSRNIQKLAKLGVKARHINNQFITKTFPNHWTISTGLYEESHGMVNNLFYDSKLNKTCKFCNDPEFYSEALARGVEPIWQSLERQTFKKAASYYWPGSDAPGFQPSYYVTPYSNKVPLKVRADQVLKWLRDSDIGMVTMYVNEPDHQGHQYGPFSDQVRQAVLKVDDLLGYILQEVHNNSDYYGDLNIVLTSDHGMTQLYNNKQILLSDFLSAEEISDLEPNFIDYVTGAHIWCENGPSQSKFSCKHYYEKLSNYFSALNNKTKSTNKAKTSPIINIFKKSDIPDHFHYKNNYRVPPLLISCEIPWQVHLKANNNQQGTHGYRPEEPDMHPIFIAAGKKIIQSDLEVEPFDSVNLYNLFCEILEISPGGSGGQYGGGVSRHNGSTLAIAHLLKDDGIEWYTLGKISFEDDWTFQKGIGLASMVAGILVGLYAVFCVKEDGFATEEVLNKLKSRKSEHYSQKENLLGRCNSSASGSSHCSEHETNFTLGNQKPLTTVLGATNNSFEDVDLKESCLDKV